MANRIRLRDARPKAFWGALIGAATSVAGSLINTSQQRKAAEEQKRQQQLADDRRLAAAMTENATLNQSTQRAYEDMFRSNFALGGLSRPGKGIVVQRGGVAQPIGHNTFLLRGMSHDDTNSKGQSGIYLNLNGRDVEAEGGEILHKNGNQFEIISDRIGYGGQSYADHVLNGENPNNIFNMQEQSKRRRLRNGGITSPVRSIAAYGDGYPPYTSWFDLDPGLWTRELGATAVYPRWRGIVGPTFTPASPGNVVLTNPPKAVTNNPYNTYDHLIKNYDEEGNVIPYKYAWSKDVRWPISKFDTYLPSSSSSSYSPEESTANTQESSTQFKPYRVDWNSMTPPLWDNPYIQSFQKDYGDISPLRPYDDDRSDLVEKAVEGDYSNGGLDWGMRTTGGDLLNAGIGVVGSLLSHAVTRRSLSDMAKLAPEAPIGVTPGKLKTFWNVNPDLSAVEQNREKANTAVTENTVSSAAATERIARNNLAASQLKDKIYAEKENKETELVNNDVLNAQRVRAQNAYYYNDYLNRRNRFNQSLAQARAANNVALIQGIGSSLSNAIQSGMDRYNDENALIAYAATADKGTLERLLKFGYPFNQRTLRGMYSSNTNDDARSLITPYLNRRSRLKLGIS